MGRSRLVASLKAQESGQAVDPMTDHDKYLPLKVLTKANVDSPESAPYLYKSTCE